MNMLRKTLVATAAVLSLGAVQANELTFQGVTFQTQAVDADTMTLTILNALSGGTGNWADINFLNAFELKGIGDITGATLAGWTSSVDSGLSANAGCETGGSPGACFVHTGGALALTDWTADVDNGLSANAGCAQGGTPGACFVHNGGALALSDSMTFEITFTGTNIDFTAPTLKVQFFAEAVQANATGDLLSQTIPIPEPETYALMLAGLGIVGFIARRRRPT